MTPPFSPATIVDLTLHTPPDPPSYFEMSIIVTITPSSLFCSTTDTPRKMTQSKAIALIAALVMSSGSAFVLPTPRPASLTGASARTSTVSGTCGSRAGVSPLEAGLGSFFSLDNFTNLFRRELYFNQLMTLDL